MASCPPSFPVQCSGRVVHSPTSLSSLTLSPLQCDCHRCQARSPCRSIQSVLFQLFSTLTSCHTWQSWISPGQHPPAFAPTSVYSVTVHLCMLSCFSRVRLFMTRFLCSWDSPDKNTGVRLPCPPPKDLPNPGIKPEAPMAPTLQVYSFTTEPPGSPKFNGSNAYCRERERERVGLLMRQRCLALLAGRGKWQPTPIFLPGESCGQRSLVGCCPWGRTGLDTTEETYQGYMH